MSLNNFLKANMPYGMERHGKKWSVFNREYLPLGSHSKEKRIELDLNIYTGLNDKKIEKIILNKDLIHYNENNEIDKIFFYNDKTSPANKKNRQNLINYFEILEKFAFFKIK